MAQAGEIFPGIEVNLEIMDGIPVISGTRVPVSVVLGHLASGDSVEAVMTAYDLSEEQIRAALGYAAQIVGSERVYPVAAGQ